MTKTAAVRTVLVSFLFLCATAWLEESRACADFDPSAVPGILNKLNSYSPSSSAQPGPARTYLVNRVDDSLWVLLGVDAQGEEHAVGAFLPSPESRVELNGSLPGQVGTVALSASSMIAVGDLVMLDGTYGGAGMQLTSVSSDDGSVQFDVGTILTVEESKSFVMGLMDAGDIESEDDDDGNASYFAYSKSMGVRFRLGSSCNCGGVGGVWWKTPFFCVIIGNNNGQACCQSACAAALAAYNSGKSLQEAWMIGQGTFVTCLIVA